MTEDASRAPDEGSDQTVVYLSPPRQTDWAPPPFANELRVIGGADAATLHFYYVSPSRFGLHEMGIEDPQISKHVAGVRIEAEPVARVAIPLTSIMQLIETLTATLATGLPALQERIAAFNQSMSRLSDDEPGGRDE